MTAGFNSFEARVSRRRALALLSSAPFLSLQSSCSSKESSSSLATATGHVGTPTAAIEPLHYRSLRDVARLIHSKNISPVELTSRLLDRITAVDSKLKSYATVLHEEALQAARRAEEEIQ